MNEKTAEILNRFKDSWNETENRFDDLIKNYPGFEFLIPVRQFMSKLRENGADNYYRIGTSMHTLVISRSVEHGLRYDQKCIKIETFDNCFYVIFCDGYKVYREYRLDSLDDIRMSKLLNTLKDTLVD